MIAKATNLFWLWTMLGVAWAWVIPGHFEWFASYISPGLGVIMLGMGLTLSFDDFRAVVRQPKAIGIGVVAQFLIMPSIGFLIAKVAGLSPGLSAGLVLVSCCPGGTASNVIAYLSRANVALSVLMTMCSTLMAVALTPVLTGWLAGEFVQVDVVQLLFKTLTVVLLPVVAGLLLNQFASRWVQPISQFSPLVSVVVIVLIVGCIIALKKTKIIDAGFPLLGAILALHVSGFAMGYAFAFLGGFGEDYRRTVSIEVGMQNSGLGAELATALSDPLAPVPAAISAFFHCLIGSGLAGIWRLNRSESTLKAIDER
jgi:BASS family bile acid:Na+ symporter